MIEDPFDLIREASELGVVLRATGKQIRFWPMERMPEQLALRIASSKHAVINALDTIPGQVLRVLATVRDSREREDLQTIFGECAAVREFDQGNDRHVAELIAFEELGKDLDRRYEKALARAQRADAELMALRASYGCTDPAIDIHKSHRNMPSVVRHNEVTVVSERSKVQSKPIAELRNRFSTRPFVGSSSPSRRSSTSGAVRRPVATRVCH